jgi:hypothetical protein
MNLFDLLFLVAAIVLAIIGAVIGSRWGFMGGAGFAAVGFFTPIIFSQIIVWIDEIRFSCTSAGKLRSQAEREFERLEGIRPKKSWRVRPQRAKDGSLIITLFFGDTRPPRRAFYRCPAGSSTPIRIAEDEAGLFIKIHPMR